MPGTNLLMSTQRLSAEERLKYDVVTRKMLHFEFYAFQPVISASKTIIGLTVYPDYPRTVFQSNEATVLLEGMVYNKEPKDLREELCDLASANFERHVQIRKRLAEFVHGCDGEFLVTIFDNRTGLTVVANDSLGRLPSFYSYSGNRFLFSREPKFIVNFLSTIHYKRESVLTYLLYGFPFGRNTLLEDVFQLEPNTILMFNSSEGTFSETTSPAYNLDFRYSSFDRSRVVHTMMDHFSGAVSCRARRFGDRTILVSLSGGLDSRATLAEVLKNHENVRAVTYSNSAELSWTREVANSLDVKLDVIPCDDPGMNAINVSLKDGLDSFQSLGLFHSFLAALRQEHNGGVVYWTGFFGGELSRFLHPTSGFSSTEDLATYLLKADCEYKYSTESVLNILGAVKKEAQECLLKYLNSFKEISPTGRYIRFRHEYDRKFTAQGEDRNRFYFWTTTPFGCLNFVKLMASVDENRKNTLLFRDFLAKVDTRLCLVPYYNLNLRLDNNFLLNILAIVERGARSAVIKSGLQRINKLTNLWRRHERGPVTSVKHRVLELLKDMPEVENCFESKNIRSIVENEQSTKGLSRMSILLLYMNYLKDLTK